MKTSVLHTATKNCARCRQIFSPSRLDIGPKRWATIKYCGVACSRKDNPPPLRDKALTQTCKHCSKIILRPTGLQSWAKRPYCGSHCAALARESSRRVVLPPKTCPECSELFGRKAGEGLARFRGRLFCSIKCANTNRNKKGYRGITPIQELIRKRHQTVFRQKVFTRDNYTCQICGVRGGKLNADHYPITFREIFYGQLWELLEDENNGRTLCQSCHYSTPTYGSKALCV